MKRPKANDEVRIKAGDDIFAETCVEAFPDSYLGARGWKFAIVSAGSYHRFEHYCLIDENGVESAISVSSIDTINKSNKKVFVFSALIPDSL